MFENVIFHPVSGEKGYFVSEEEAKFIRAVVSDFRYNRLAAVESITLVDGDFDE